jgi:hypothetical protein
LRHRIAAVPFDKGTQRLLGHEATPTEANDREVTSSHQLVGEGPGYAEELRCLADGDDQAILPANRNWDSTR